MQPSGADGAQRAALFAPAPAEAVHVTLVEEGEERSAPRTVLRPFQSCLQGLVLTALHDKWILMRRFGGHQKKLTVIQQARVLQTRHQNKMCMHIFYISVSLSYFFRVRFGKKATETSKTCLFGCWTTWVWYLTKRFSLEVINVINVKLVFRPETG